MIISYLGNLIFILESQILVEIVIYYYVFFYYYICNTMLMQRCCTHGGTLLDTRTHTQITNVRHQ